MPEISIYYKASGNTDWTKKGVLTVESEDLKAIDDALA